jgi:hypothetical protein
MKSVHEVQSGHLRLCRLEWTLGGAEACPDVECPFWEGGPAPKGGCVLADVQEVEQPEVAHWLLRVRRHLEAARRQAGGESASFSRPRP